MLVRAIAVLLVALCCSMKAAAVVSPIPNQLTVQVSRLVLLLSDGYAQGYPAATLYQPIKNGSGQEFILVVFTVEGFGGGNMFSQYFAVFSRGADANGRDYFSLVDVVPIGGKGWRTVEKLGAKVLPSKAKEELVLAVEVKENTEQDAPNFPSKKATVVLSLKDARLKEVKAP